MTDQAYRSRDAPSTLLARELLESDRRYFESAASVEEYAGARVVKMPECMPLAAACVVQRVNTSALSFSTAEWLGRIERNLREMGCSWARFYLQSPIPKLATALAQRGYKSSTEIGFLKRPLTVPPPSANCNFRIVSSEKDWTAKLQLHRACEQGPDGYPCLPEKWVHMERRKVEAGYMDPYLVRLDGAACGVVSVAECAHLLRLKNIVIHPDFRGEGIGREVVRHVLREARNRGQQAVGVFGVEDAPGASLYESCGFTAATSQVEWARGLGTQDGPE